jgi:tetratricopeptide (TPR) repeat protein
MNKSASAPCLGRPENAGMPENQRAPVLADEGLSLLLNNHGLGGHAPELCARLGVSNLWHLSLLSYQHIEASSLPPVVKGFLTGLLFHPSHLMEVIDKKYWSADLAKYAAAEQSQAAWKTPPLQTNQELTAPQARKAAQEEEWQELNEDEPCQDLWGTAVPVLMQQAKLSFCESDYAGALKKYGLAIEWYEKEADSSPPPNILIDMAICYSKKQSWALALQRATKALELLLRSDQPRAWSLEPERLRILKSEALALKARSELFLGLLAEHKATLRDAKKFGLHLRVKLALNHMAQTALNRSTPTAPTEDGPTPHHAGHQEEEGVPSRREDPRINEHQESPNTDQNPSPSTNAHLQDLWGKDVIHRMTAANPRQG